MIYYISDLHFGHANVIEFDKRPFANVEEMDRIMIERWNERVSDMDDVYISGDFAHHDYLFALENEFAVIEYSHYSSEIIVEDLFEKILSVLDGLKIVKAQEKRPFRTMEEL